MEVKRHAPFVSLILVIAQPISIHSRCTAMLKSWEVEIEPLVDETKSFILMHSYYNYCRFGQVYHNLQSRVTRTLLHAFLDPTRTLPQHYGAIKGLAALGPSVVSNNHLSCLANSYLARQCCTSVPLSIMSTHAHKHTPTHPHTQKENEVFILWDFLCTSVWFVRVVRHLSPILFGHVKL